MKVKVATVEEAETESVAGVQVWTEEESRTGESPRAAATAFVLKSKERFKIQWQLTRQRMSHVTLRRAHQRKADRDNQPYPRQLGSQGDLLPASPTRPRGFKATIPSAPFDDEAMFDPWAFNHDLHMPHSAQRNDTAGYEREAFEAWQAAQTMKSPSTPRRAFRMARFYDRVDHAKAPFPGEPMDLD